MYDDALIKNALKISRRVVQLALSDNISDEGFLEKLSKGVDRLPDDVERCVLVVGYLSRKTKKVGIGCMVFDPYQVYEGHGVSE